MPTSAPVLTRKELAFSGVILSIRGKALNTTDPLITPAAEYITTSRIHRMRDSLMLRRKTLSIETMIDPSQRGLRLIRSTKLPSGAARMTPVSADVSAIAVRDQLFAVEDSLKMSRKYTEACASDSINTAARTIFR